MLALFAILLAAFINFSNTNSAQALYLDKEDYSLGEQVLIHAGLESGSKIVITSPDGGIYEYFGDLKDTTPFFPKKLGRYTVQALVSGSVADSKTFKVTPSSQNSQSQSTRPLGINSLRKNLNPVKYDFSLDENPEFDFEYKSKFSLSYTGLSSKKYSNRIATSEGDVEASVYDLRGKPAMVTPELEETIEGINIKIPKTRGVKPGVYKMRVKLSKNGETVFEEKEFAWGLISLNTKKSIYEPGEKADLIMVVLDSYGYGVCDAEIRLMVVRPDGVVSVYSPEDISQDADCGLYYASFTTKIEGEHFINVSTVVDGKGLSFDTHFLVMEDYDYEIIRTAESKIDPTQVNLFGVSIDVSSYDDVGSLLVKEYVPSVFTISDTSAEVVDGNPKTLVWRINDRKAVLKYKYSVPLIWPYLYELGPLNVNGFEEYRPWYVAVDPPPELHVVEGYVFINEQGLQAPTSTVVFVNSTGTQEFFYTETYGPPGETGYYSLSVNGSDGDEIVVTAYNATFYGRINTSLSGNPSITEANLTLNITRDPEANVTIDYPPNNTIFYVDTTFNATSTITILGNDGVNCNATIGFDNSILNLTVGENFTLDRLSDNS